MTGYETFSLYQAIKLHFSQESYDFFKYNGKSNVSLNSFDNRKDKYHFHKLSRRYQDKDDMINFIVSNFVENEKTWVGSLLQDEAEINYRNHQKVIQSLSYMFENDCKTVFDGIEDPNSVLKTDGDYPVLLRSALRKEIHIESLCLLNNILNFIPVWSKKINDTIHWPNFRIRVLKYSSFLPKETTKYKLILKKVIDR